MRNPVKNKGYFKFSLYSFDQPSLLPSDLGSASPPFVKQSLSSLSASSDWVFSEGDGLAGESDETGTWLVLFWPFEGLESALLLWLARPPDLPFPLPLAFLFLL